MSEARRARGIRGEDVAAAWYASQGYELVARNWRCRTGELVLIVRRGPTFVFCEVKSKGGPGFGDPLEMVTEEKVRRVRRAAEAWLAARPRYREFEVRFDVVVERGRRLECLRAAF